MSEIALPLMASPYIVARSSGGSYHQPFIDTANKAFEEYSIEGGVVINADNLNTVKNQDVDLLFIDTYTGGSLDAYGGAEDLIKWISDGNTDRKSVV